MERHRGAICMCLWERMCVRLYVWVCVWSTNPEEAQKAQFIRMICFYVFCMNYTEQACAVHFAIFIKSVLQSLFFLSSLVGIMACCLKTWIIERLLGMGSVSTPGTGVSRDSSRILTHSEPPVPLPHTSTGHASSLLAAQRQSPSAANTGQANAHRDWAPSLPHLFSQR